MPAIKPAQPIRLYRHALSGHAHRIELFLSLLELPVELIDVDLIAGAHKKAEFLAKNPLGQIPVIEDGDFTLSDSNAILVYLATKYGDESWLPRDPQGAGLVQRFLSLAAGEIAKGPALARVINLFKIPQDPATAKSVALQLFGVIDAHLANRTFLVGSQPTIADISCYSYIALAPEGGVSLADYGNIRNWLARVEALPRFVPMLRTPIGLAA